MDISIGDVVMKATATCPSLKDNEPHGGKVVLHLLRGGHLSFRYIKPHSPEITYKGKWALASSTPDICYRVKIGFKSHAKDGRPITPMHVDSVGEPEAGAEVGSFILAVEGGCDLKVRGTLPSGVRYLLQGTPLELEEHNRTLGLEEATVQDARQAQRRAKMCAIFAWADQNGNGSLNKHEVSKWRHETSGETMDSKSWIYFSSCLGIDPEQGIPRHKFLGPLGPYLNYPHELEDHFQKLSTKYATVFKNLRTVRSAQVAVGVGLFATDPLEEDMMEEQKAELVAKAFREWDADGNGKISRSELTQVLTSLDQSITPKSAESLFKAMDRDGDGEVDYEEFVNWLFQGGRAA